MLKIPEEKLNECMNELSKSTYNFYKLKLIKEIRKITITNEKEVPTKILENIIIYSISNVVQNVLINLVKTIEAQSCDPKDKTTSIVNIPMLEMAMNKTFDVIFTMCLDLRNELARNKMN